MFNFLNILFNVSFFGFIVCIHTCFTLILIYRFTNWFDSDFNISIDSVDRFVLVLPVIKRRSYNEIGRGKYLYKRYVVNRNYEADGIDNYFVESNYWESIFHE